VSHQHHDPSSPLGRGESAGIVLENLTKTFPGTTGPAVDHLTLDIPAGALVVLVGPSGCGKTTTLKMINRLIEPSGGRIEIGGVDARELRAHELRRSIGYVIQQTGLFPHLTIAANIGTVPRLLGWSKDRIRERVDELADLVHLDRDLLRRYPPELSGGQQQRVGVARALAADPPVLLMDEPYSAVDPIVRTRLQDELLDLQARMGKTIVVVTHDVDEAIKLGDRIAILKVGGVLAQYDDPARLLSEPADDFVASFLGEDRELKRLALVRVGDIVLDAGPVVTADATPAAARQQMAACRTNWAAVLDGDRLLGWVSADDLNGQASVAVAALRPFRTTVRDDDSLRRALDGILRSQTGVAAVVDAEGRHRGLVSIDGIRNGSPWS
jgi:osmoprotectant transport system ATP-binding protein